MQINGVDFLITFECPSKCKHCAYGGAPERAGVMTDAINWLKELVETQELQTVLIHGGEPFLYYPLLKDFMKKAKEWEIPQRYVITNGFWAETVAVAKKKLNELKDAGLTHISFSVDAFHQEYISFNLVKNGIEAATSLDFEKVYVDCILLDKSNGNNTYDLRTRKLIENLSEFDEIELSAYQLHFWERAADILTNQFNLELKAEIPKGPCVPPFWIGNDLGNPETLEIDFEGLSIVNIFLPICGQIWPNIPVEMFK